MSSSPWQVFNPNVFDAQSRREDQLAGQIGAQAPRHSWHTFMTRDLVFRTGEHVGLIGPTGQGKTTLGNMLLPLHKYVTVFATKPVDSSMQYLIDHDHYIMLPRWRSLDPKDFPRRVIWPDAKDIDSEDLQKRVFTEAMGKIYRDGHWTLYIDETWWLDQVLGMRKLIEVYLFQARSLKISLIAGTQRPAWVPRALYTQATHLFFWRTNDETDLNSLSGIGFRSARLIREVVSNLDQYEFLYINTRTGAMVRSKVPYSAARKGSS